jgi:diaminopimelate decarboxylase
LVDGQAMAPPPRAAAQLDGVDLHALAARLGTPLYVYSARAIRQRIAALRDGFHGLDPAICFAVKANPSLGVLRLMAQHGLGADIVSGGELRRALMAGIEPGRIVFSGVGKSAREIETALECGIWKFNVESEDELRLLDRLAGERGVLAHTDLGNFNSATSILTEDVGVAAGAGFLLLGRAEGAQAKGCSLAVDEFIKAAAAA